MTVFFWLFLAAIGLFALIYFWERRSIFISLFALNIPVWALAWIISTGILENNEILRLLAIAVVMVLFLAFLSGPFVLISTLYLNGFQILKREGVHLHNFLSMGLAVALTFYLFIAPFVVQSLSDISFFNMVFIYVGFLVSYAIIIACSIPRLALSICPCDQLLSRFQSSAISATIENKVYRLWRKNQILL